MVYMSTGFSKNQRLWVPERSYGVCIWILPNGQPLSDGDGVLSAEGYVGDKNIERMVAEAAKYWTQSEEGYAAWVGGARKVTSSERDDQIDRLNNGLIPDPYEDVIEDVIRRH